ncbi:MAG: methyl-accepting chemotaxis protein, partial [Oscillospiraceae bacterium]|nr:methyl-accepting chemotaxis protein [Oscillospiraceae bacterium]
MKNMKVSAKLILSFMIAIAFMAVVGILGIVGMLQMDTASTDMYENQTTPLVYMSSVLESLQKMRVSMREYIIGVATDDMKRIDDTYSSVMEVQRDITQNLDAFYDTMVLKEAIQIFDDARRLYDTRYKDCLKELYELAKSGASLDDMDAVLDEYLDDNARVTSEFEEVMAYKVTNARDASDEIASMAQTLLTAIIILLVVAVAVALTLAIYISGLISKPIGALTTFLKKASSTGDIALSQVDRDTIGRFAQAKDEIGQCIGAAASFISRITQIAEELDTVANGDLTRETKSLSDKDVMGISLINMVEGLNEMFGEINSSTAQVSTGSKQVADGAQALAQGSTQQAAAVEQLSSSISEISEKTKVNSEMADK